MEDKDRNKECQDDKDGNNVRNKVADKLRRNFANASGLKRRTKVENVGPFVPLVKTTAPKSKKKAQQEASAPSSTPNPQKANDDLAGDVVKKVVPDAANELVKKLF